MAVKKNPRNYGDFRDNISDKDFTRLKDLQDEHKEIQGRIDRASAAKDESHPDYMSPENIKIAQARQSQIITRRKGIIQPYKEGKVPVRTDPVPKKADNGYSGSDWEGDLKKTAQYIHENSSFVDPKTKKRKKGIYDPETGKAASKEVLEGRAAGHLMGVNHFRGLQRGSAEPVESGEVPRGLQVSPEVREKNNSVGNGGALIVTDSNESKEAPVNVREEARNTIHKVVEKPDVPHESVADIAARRQATPVTKRTPSPEEAADHAARMEEYREAAKSDSTLKPPSSPYEEGYSRPHDFGAPVVRRDQKIAEQKKREKDARASAKGQPVVQDTARQYNVEKVASRTVRRTASAQTSSTQFGGNQEGTMTKPVATSASKVSGPANPVIPASLGEQLKAKLGGTSSDSDLSSLAAMQNGSAPVTPEPSRSIGTPQNPHPNSIEGRASTKAKTVQSPSEDAPDSAGRLPAVQKQLPSKAMIGMPPSRQLSVTNPHFSKKEDSQPEPVNVPSPVKAGPQFSTPENTDGSLFPAEPYRTPAPAAEPEAPAPVAKRNTRQGVLFDTKGRPNPRAIASSGTNATPGKTETKPSAPQSDRLPPPSTSSPVPPSFTDNNGRKGTVRAGQAMQKTVPTPASAVKAAAAEPSDGGLFPAGPYRKEAPAKPAEEPAKAPGVNTRQGVLFDKKGKPNPRAVVPPSAPKSSPATPDFSGLPDVSQHEGGMFPTEGLRRLGPENNPAPQPSQGSSRNPRQGVLFDTKGNPNPRAVGSPTGQQSTSGSSRPSVSMPQQQRQQPRHSGARQDSIPHAAASSPQFGGGSPVVNNHYYSYNTVHNDNATHVHGSNSTIATDNASININSPGAGGGGYGAPRGNMGKTIITGNPNRMQKFQHQLINTSVNGHSIAGGFEHVTGGKHLGVVDDEGLPVGKPSDSFVREHPVNKRTNIATGNVSPGQFSGRERRQQVNLNSE